MSRMYETKEQNSDSETVMIDLHKVCLVRLETQAGHAYPKVAIRFVDGREDDDLVPEQHAHHLLDAYLAASKPQTPSCTRSPTRSWCRSTCGTLHSSTTEPECSSTTWRPLPCNP